MGALLAAAIVVFAVWTFAVVATGHWREWHHEYVGVPLVAAAVLGVAPPWVGWLGLLVMLDDCAQHLVQMVDPEFRSPAHLLYRWLLYEPWHRMRR